MASQGVGLVTGVQDRVSWKGVAFAAISGAVGGGVQAAASAASFSAGSNLATGAVMGVGRSVVTQGVSMALGLQSRFDWTGVALAGITGGVGAQTEASLARQETWNGVSLARGGMANTAITGVAGALAGAAGQSMLTGSSFGDNLIDRLPDVIGSTIGNMVGARINAAIEARAAEARLASEATSFLAEEVLGNGPWTPEQTQQAQALRTATLASIRDPDNGAARRAVNAEVNRLLELAPDNPNVRAFDDMISPTRTVAGTSAPGDVVDDIVVIGRRDYWAGRTIDSAGVWVGENKSRIEGRVGQFIAQTPGAGIALGVANVGLTIAGGPTRFLAGMALDHAGQQVTGWVADQLERSDWASEKARSGGEGFVFAASAIVGGASVLRGGLALGSSRNAVQNGVVGERPSWRASELDVGARIEGQGYRPQVSFKDGGEVPYGTRGSVRPEYYNRGSSIEVKNYNVESPRGRASLVRNVSDQAVDRARNLPAGTAQSVYIDIRGQNVSRTDLNVMVSRIVQRSDGALRPIDINIVR